MNNQQKEKLFFVILAFYFSLSLNLLFLKFSSIMINNERSKQKSLLSVFFWIITYVWFLRFYSLIFFKFIYVISYRIKENQIFTFIAFSLKLDIKTINIENKLNIV